MEEPSSRSPYAFGRGEAPTFTFASGNRVEVKVGERQSEGRLTLIEGTHMPHTGPPLHVHDDVDEIWGMDVIVCTTAGTDDEARALLKALNFPFRQ